MYLNEISDCFNEELKNTYGSSSGVDYQSKIETIDNSYAFLKFGMWIGKLMNCCRESDNKEEKGVQRFKYKGKFG